MKAFSVLLTKWRIQLGMVSVCVMAVPLDAFAQQTLPKWELGLGPGIISYPDYPGSKEQNNLIIPFPFVTYRGKDFEIDQREAKKPLFGYGEWELDLSLTGSVPVSSKDNKMRQGMDDLDTTVGFGPVVKYRLIHRHLNELKFEMPVYWAIATNFRSLHEEGIKTTPGLYYYFRKSFSTDQRIKITLYTNANFATAKNNNYFYEVKVYEATSWRPDYRTEGGFGGYSYGASVNWHFGNFWLGAFYKLTDLSEAVFRHSPLVETTRAETFGAALTWNFYKSSETVEGLE
jgi:outer membrane protein